MTGGVVIVGRPNVGKSTLFNRLVGKGLAIVDDLPGVTRDRREGVAHLGDLHFPLVDTAGLDDPRIDELHHKMWLQTEKALYNADVILFVLDGREGLTSMDEHYAHQVRRYNKPVILLANKCEGQRGVENLGEISQLGFQGPIAISAAHNEGLADLYEAIRPFVDQGLVEEEKTEHQETILQLAIVGRPNVGKSTLVNQLLKEERLITSPIAGTTRDPIAIEWAYKNQPLRLVDTAGLRRRSKITNRLEKLTVSEALRVVRYAHMVVLVLDNDTPLSKQDLKIGAQVVEEGRVLVIALNKWDLVKNKDAFIKEIRQELAYVLPQVKGVPCIPISAKEGKNLTHVLDAVLELYEKWNCRISTGRLNQWLESTLTYHPPPIVGRNRINIKYMTQIKTRPPTFVLFTSKPTELPEAYVRYMVNSLREEFDLPGIPIRLMTRKGKNPYVKKG